MVDRSAAAHACQDVSERRLVGERNTEKLSSHQRHFSHTLSQRWLICLSAVVLITFLVANKDNTRKHTHTSLNNDLNSTQQAANRFRGRLEDRRERQLKQITE